LSPFKNKKRIYLFYEIATTATKPSPPLPPATETTQGGVYLPDDLKSRESTASIIGYVIKLGPDAYDDPKFKNGPWCKPGDFIIFRPYSGTRFKVGKAEYRLINDDTPEAVVENPDGYERAF